MSYETNKEISRRNFLMKLGVGLGSVAAAAVAIPVIGALLAPLLENKQRVWRTVGKLDDFKIGGTSLVKFVNADPVPYAGVTANTAAWLRRNSENQFTAFSVNCTHLGCPVRWEQQAQLFMCPCHGGVYYKDGSVAAGPPPKELTQYAVRIYNGEVQILTSPLPITNINASHT
jgi:menaquinol-cytochrome c reductase iron-sulfur subunit